MIRASKDALASQAARLHLNRLLARYGKVQTLKIDSQLKRVEIVCLLQGEREPLAVRVEKYTIQRENGRTYLHLEACHCDRPWLHNLLRDFGQSRPLELPAWVAPLL